MGRAKILENLGEGHYRIGLDLDLTYARRQLAEAQAYLDAFAARYQAAQDAVTDARAALVTVNDDLSSYLAAAQAACEAAYQAERAAYQDYIDAVNSQPAPGVAAGLLASAEAAHDAFMGVFTDELAMAATAADADYQAGVGNFLDEPAVLDAEAVKLSGLSALLTARDEYADDLITLAEYQAAQNAYDTLRGDWLTVIADNSGDPMVKHYKDIWEAARDAFDKARADLGKLIGNGGGIPAELEALLKKQAETYAALRAAEKDLQSLTLIKAEKERFILELTQRLAPYTDEQGDPVFPPVNAWCVDYTDDLAVDATVGTIEIPGERYLSVRVRPGYESRETWNAEREGLLSPSWSMSPESTWFNWVLHAGNARWNPNARLGVIQAIDSTADTCTVVLDPQSNSPATVAPEGAVMEVNSPIKYVIDENGVEQSVLPGPNVTVVEGVTILANVPIEYMECNSGAFVVGDHVMVQFTGQAWTAPKVVGFAESPRPCALPGLLLSASIPPTLETLHIRDKPEDADFSLAHDRTSRQTENIDWISADGKTRLTWRGPLGRSIPPQMLEIDSINEFDGITFNSHEYNLSIYTVENYQYGTKHYIQWSRFGSIIYKNGKAVGNSPKLVGNSFALVLGCAVIRSPSSGHYYIVAAFGYDKSPIHYYGFATISNSGIGTWSIFHAENLSNSTEHNVFGPSYIYAFSTSGLKFASICQTYRTFTINKEFYSYRWTEGEGEFIQNSKPIFPTSGVGSDVVIRGTIELTDETIRLVNISVIEQSITRHFESHSAGDQINEADGYRLDNNGDGIDDISYSINTSSSTSSRADSSQQSGSEILAIDFIGEEEVTLISTINYDLTGYSSSNELSSIERTSYLTGTNNGDYDTVTSVQYAGSGNYKESKSVVITSSKTNNQIGYWNSEYEYVLSGSGGIVTTVHVDVSLLDPPPPPTITTDISGNDPVDIISITTTGHMKMPIYYDLRNGQGIYEVSSFLVAETATKHHSSGVYITRTQNEQCTRSYIDESGFVIIEKNA